MELSGAIPPMVTPTQGRTGGIDEPTLRSYTEFLVDGGVHGLFPCASIGEFSSLTAAERRTVIEIVAETAPDGLPVLAGCGGTAVGEVLAHIDAAAGAGADAAVVVTPYYLSTTQAGLREFYATVAEWAALPIVLYNIPQLTGQALEADTVLALAERDDIVGVKDSCGDFSYHFELVAGAPESFAVIQGLSGLGLPALDTGADGMISGAADVFPAAIATLYEAYRDGDRDRSVGIATEVMTPVVSAYSDVPTASGLKYLVRRRGFDVGPPVLPLPELEQSARDRLANRYDTASTAAERLAE